MPRTTSKPKSSTVTIIEAFMALTTDAEGAQIIEVLQTLQRRMSTGGGAETLADPLLSPTPLADPRANSRTGRGGGRPKGSRNKVRGPQAAGPQDVPLPGAEPMQEVGEDPLATE